MTDYRSVLMKRGGFLAAGSHCHYKDPDCPVCVLELAALAKYNRLIDNPQFSGFPDIRPINDAYESKERRTEALLPWLEALDNHFYDRVVWSGKVILEYLRQLLPLALDPAGIPSQSFREISKLEDAPTLIRDYSSISDFCREADLYRSFHSLNSAVLLQLREQQNRKVGRLTLNRDELTHTISMSAVYISNSMSREDRQDVLDRAVRIQIEATKP